MKAAKRAPRNRKIEHLVLLVELMVPLFYPSAVHALRQDASAATHRRTVDGSPVEALRVAVNFQGREGTHMAAYDIWEDTCAAAAHGAAAFAGKHSTNEVRRDDPHRMPL